MSKELELIRQVIEAHHTIREHIKVTGAAVNDFEALFDLQRAQSGWAVTSAEALSKAWEKLHLTLSLLEEGITKHFGFEEKALPPLFGEILMRALKLEHTEIGDRIMVVKSLIADTKFDTLSRQDLLSKKSQIHQQVSDLSRMIEEHASKEELILKMMEHALQEAG